MAQVHLTLTACVPNKKSVLLPILLTSFLRLIIYCINDDVVAEQKAYLKSAHRNSENPGFSRGDCPTSPKNDLYGWHFILKGNTASFISINCTFRIAGIVTDMIQQPSNKHAYVFTPTSDTLVNAWAIIDGSETEFVLSHVCSPSVPLVLTTTTTPRSSTNQLSSSITRSSVQENMVTQGITNAPSTTTISTTITVEKEDKASIDTTKSYTMEKNETVDIVKIEKNIQPVETINTQRSVTTNNKKVYDTENNKDHTKTMRNRSNFRRHSSSSSTNNEANYIRDFTIDTLSYLLPETIVHIDREQLSSKVGCRLKDVYVNYVYEYDFHHQIFNSSFQDFNSALLQNFQADLTSFIAEEVYQRNMALDVSNNVRIMKILDVTKQYHGLPTVRYYLTMVIRKTQIPLIRQIFSNVLKKIQTKNYATINARIDGNHMVMIH